MLLLQAPVTGPWAARSMQAGDGAAAAQRARFAAAPLHSADGRAKAVLLVVYSDPRVSQAAALSKGRRQLPSSATPAAAAAASCEGLSDGAVHMLGLLEDPSCLADLARYLSAVLFDGGDGQRTALAYSAALHALAHARSLQQVLQACCSAASGLAEALHCVDMHASMALVPTATSSHALFVPAIVGAPLSEAELFSPKAGPGKPRASGLARTNRTLPTCMLSSSFGNNR